MKPLLWYLLTWNVSRLIEPRPASIAVVKWPNPTRWFGKWTFELSDSFYSTACKYYIIQRSNCSQSAPLDLSPRWIVWYRLLGSWTNYVLSQVWLRSPLQVISYVLQSRSLASIPQTRMLTARSWFLQDCTANKLQLLPSNWRIIQRLLDEILCTSFYLLLYVWTSDCKVIRMVILLSQAFVIQRQLWHVSRSPYMARDMWSSHTLNWVFKRPIFEWRRKQALSMGQWYWQDKPSDDEVKPGPDQAFSGRHRSDLQRLARASRQSDVTLTSHPSEKAKLGLLGHHPTLSVVTHLWVKANFRVSSGCAENIDAQSHTHEFELKLKRLRLSLVSEGGSWPLLVDASRMGSGHIYIIRLS
jgi:hypothetical protein